MCKHPYVSMPLSLSLYIMNTFCHIVEFMSSSSAVVLGLSGSSSFEVCFHGNHFSLLQLGIAIHY